MCGIFCAFYRNANSKSLVEDVLLRNKRLLNNRGPDRQSCVHVGTSDNSGILMCGTTLHMRGDNPTKQPLIRHGNLLLWNGEIFDGIELTKEENDGQVLLNQLLNCISDSEILDIIAKVQGPYSLIYWQASSRRLWFGRDVLGRRSLLHLIDGSSFVMSSVAFESQAEWQELPASGIYCLNVDEMISENNSQINDGINNESNGEDMTKQLTLFPWLWRKKDFTGQLRIVSDWSEEDLFSHHILKPCFKSINISHTGILCSLSKLNRQQNDTKELVPASNLSDLETETRKSALSQLLHHLSESVRKRTEDSSVPRLCSSCIKKMLDHSNDQSKSMTSDRLNEEICSHAKVAVLFSGGIDSLVLAALTDRFIPVGDPIDLLNVSFIDPNKKGTQQAPDRMTGINGWKELKRINPNRVWNFVEIDVSLEKLQEQRQERIRHLIKPLDSVIDDSIGCAIWFAAQGHGNIRSNDDDDDDDDVLKPYISRSRVLILGMGADELFAGYSRHRMRFMHEGLEGLAKELEFEIQNISCRNMGRDDRIVSDHSKEARFPYLDEELVNFVLSLDMETKFDLRLPRGMGEKLLLRLLAKEIGLERGATLHKRAIQFGSRIAKLENKNEKANHKCLRLQNDDDKFE